MLVGPEDRNRSLEVISAAEGQVTEIAARPGEIVTEGQALLTLTSFERILARIEIPLGDRAPQDVKAARIAVAGTPSEWRPAEVLGPAPVSTGGGATWLLRVDIEGTLLRPGLLVLGRLALPGDPIRGSLVPGSAVFRSDGRTWIYVEEETGRYFRREVRLENETPDGWIVTSALSPGERLVVGGAQVLLSEEQKPRIRVLEEEEGR
jgi:multidrug efflux pump subunit AcrA (membrane-fusion protein)